MPSSDFNEARRFPKFPATIPSDHQQQQENLPCPRCDSINTKFCYYNNYNFSQPRHFCKSCRRYWTHGGTLRDIPVGGVSRKSSKRSRVSSSSSGVSTASTVSNAVAVGSRNFPLQATPVLFPPSTNTVKGHCGGFTSLLNYNHAAAVKYGPNGGFNVFHGPNDGFGLGLGQGSYFDDVRFGQGITVWPFSSTGGNCIAASSSADATTVTTTTTSHVTTIPATWQFVSGDYN